MAAAVVRLEAWGDPNRTEFQVRFDPTGIAMWPADSGCQMDITVEVAPDGTKVGGPCLVAVQGTVRIADTASQTGIEIPMQALGPNYRTLRVPMTAADIVHIEARRADAPEFMCSINLSGIANLVVGQGTVTMAVHSNMAAPFAIGREQWLRMLDRAHHGWTRLVELPAIAGPAGPEWAACTALLERATGEYRSHASETAIATCRQVLEGLVSVLATRWAIPRKQHMREWLRELQQSMEGTWPDDKAAAGVLTSLYMAVWSWTSGSHHYNAKVPLHQEAAFAIGLTSELLVHAGHLLVAHPGPLMPSPAATDGSATPASPS